MRGWSFVGIAVGVAACYSPTPPSGAPCSETASCPTGQVCIADVCVAPGDPPKDGAEIDGAVDAAEDDAAIDAMIDAALVPDVMPDAPANDRDSDGVLNALDDCPDDFDPLQADEDGDHRGDACDPCPVNADPSADIDGDGDGVGNGCDPQPLAPGNAITFFEGFSGGIPAGWMKGDHVTVVPGGVHFQDTSTTENLMTTVVPGAHAGIWIGFRADTDTGPFGAGWGVGLTDGTSSLACGPGRTGSSKALLLTDQDTSIPTTIASANLNWPLPNNYGIGIRRDDDGFVCMAAASSTQITSTMSGTDETQASAKILIGEYYISGTLDWIYVVSENP